MDLLTALLACNLYVADEPLVRAIAQSNSHGNPYAVVDAATDYRELSVPPEPKTLEEAGTRLAGIIYKGGRPLLGLMQVPPAWMSAFGRETNEAFDVCVNISVGSAILAAMDRECAVQPSVAVDLPSRQTRRRRLPQTETLGSRRACVVARYGEAIGMSDFGLLIRLELGAQPARSSSHGGADAPIVFPVPDARAWGPDRIFVTMTGNGSGAAPAEVERVDRPAPSATVPAASSGAERGQAR